MGLGVQGGWGNVFGGGVGLNVQYVPCSSFWCFQLFCSWFKSI